MKFNPNYHHRRSIRLKGYDYSMEGLYFVTLCTHKKLCVFGEIAENQMVLNDAGKIANDYWLEIPVHFPNAILHEHIIMPNHVHGIVELTTVNTGLNDGAKYNSELTVGAENILPQQCTGSATTIGVQRIDFTVGAENVLPLQRRGSAIPIGGQRIDPNVGAENILPLQRPGTEIQFGAKNILPQQQQPQRRQNEFQKMIPGSIGAIIKGYKIGVTKWLRQNQSDDFPSGQPVWQRNYYEHIIRNEQAFYSISDYIMNNPANWNDDQLFSL
ncbi:MAG: hypothetical protein J0L62_15770 [Bacteroidetes bacterium]|nr:hypothetical protein [Bacteroidota bacterium]